MKSRKLLIAVLMFALLLSPSAASAAIALVTSTVAGSSNANSVTTSSLDTTGANLLVVCVADIQTGAVTVSDSKSNTWTPLTERTNGTTVRQRMYYCAPTSVGSSHTFTASITGGQPTISVHAFSGAASSPLDLESGGTGTSATSKQPGSLTPSQDNCVLVTGINFRGGNTGSINSGFTASTTNFVFSQHVGGGGAYLIQTTATAVNPTWSWTSSNDTAAAMASFKAAATSKPHIWYYYR